MKHSPYPICPTCSGVHKGIPNCLGRKQTDEEWMIDRGVRPERAREIIAARFRVDGLAPLARDPDPSVLNVPPFGAPAPVPRTIAEVQHPPIQEALF